MTLEQNGYSGFLTEAEFVAFLKIHVARLTKRSWQHIHRVEAIMSYFQSKREGWKDQDYWETQANKTDRWFTNFFVELSTERKLLALQKLPFTSYMQILYAIKFFVAGMLPGNDEVSPTTVRYLSFVSHVDCEKLEAYYDDQYQKINGIVSGYIKTLSRKSHAQLKLIFDYDQQLSGGDSHRMHSRRSHGKHG